MRRYDDDYTGDLERALYGRRVTLPRRATGELGEIGARLLDSDLGRAIRDVGSWLMFRTMPDDFAGSRIATAGRLIILAALTAAAVMVALVIAGVVPWDS